MAGQDKVIHFYLGLAKIIRVIDGDTFVTDIKVDVWPGISVVLDSEGPGTIRLIKGDGSKYDAPERKTPEGVAAKAFAESLLPIGSSVVVGCRGMDSFGRSLCFVTLPDGRDMATVMTEAGHVKGHTMERTFDRLYEEDARSEQYPMRLLWLAEQPAISSKLWPLDVQLDQGREGACVGFGFAHEAAAAPEQVPNVTNGYARDWYCKAQAADPWAGGSCAGNMEPFYEGTSTLAGAKVGVQLGNYSSYLWAQSEEEIARTVSNYGPVVIGVNWYSGMMTPDSEDFIFPSGKVVGGHCIVVIGLVLPGSELQKELDIPNDVIGNGAYILQNSWGWDWGDNGRCFLHRENMARLLEEGGDACVLTRVHIDPDPTPDPEPVPPTPEPKTCTWWTKFLNWITGGKMECP